MSSVPNDDMARMVSAENLKRRVQSRDSFYGTKDSVYIQDPKGIRKMSEIILEFAHPLLDEAQSFDDYKKVILLAMLAWNLGLGDESESNSKIKKLCNDLARSMDDDVVVEFRERLTSMIHRKRAHFSEVKRMVMDWDLVPMKDSFHLNVVSMLIDGDRDAKKIEHEVRKLVESSREICT